MRIALPLPLDVASTLMNVISQVYPSAAIDMSAKNLDILLDKQDRVDPKADGGDPFEGAKRFASAFEAEVVALTATGDLHLAAPRLLSEVVVPLARAATQAPGVENYLTWEVQDTDGSRYVISAAKSSGQTPHALREAAERKATVYAARLRELGIDPDEIQTP